MKIYEKNKLFERRARKHTLPIVGALGIANVPLLFTLPAWVALWCFILWAYAVTAHVKNGYWPGRPVRLTLTIVGCILVFSFLGQGGWLGGSTFVGLLAVMAGLKPLENERHRDRMMTLFLVYFTIISSLFVIENLLIAIYMFFSVFIATAVLIYFNHSGRPAADALRLSATLMAQAIPVMILLFVFFPRMEGTFFAFRASSQGRTGFSDTLKPGAVSRLVKDNTTAFRAEFTGNFPKAEDLYWRGLVLWDFDGSVWKRGNNAVALKKQHRGQRVLEYDISIEPHRRRYLFALDLPVSTPAFTQLTEDYMMVRRWPLTRGMRYHVTSYTDLKTEASVMTKVRALQLPVHGNPESRDLAKDWLDSSQSQNRVIDKAIEYFESNDFQYTLNPPLLDKDPVDRFLFETRKGYCEHYASAFAFLMRAAGIPARVVVGYLGGERNPYGGYLIIKQYHAHAWTEVFLEDSGWVRVDPTTAVVPERVSIGLAQSLVSGELPDFLSRTKFGRIGLYWQKAVFMWDSVNLRWNAWFMEFSRSEQMGLWARLWLNAWLYKKQLVFALVFLLGIWVAGRFYRTRRLRSNEAKDRVAAGYVLFCRKLARAGIRREAFVGPRDFAHQVGVLRADLKDPVHEIIQHYIRLRYAEKGDANTVKSFLRKIKKFRPAKRPAHRLS